MENLLAVASARPERKVESKVEEKAAVMALPVSEEKGKGHWKSDRSAVERKSKLKQESAVSGKKSLL